MNKLVTYGVIAAVAVALVASPVLAAAIEGYLTIKKAKVETDDDEVEAKLKTYGMIPTDGSGGAFGYGLLTSAGLDGIVVATTHGGVYDSALQSGAADPAWHNHYVKLIPSTFSGCDDNPGAIPALEVADITFGSPGDFEVEGKMFEFDDMPASFTGPRPALVGGGTTTITPGTDVGLAVSFTLDAYLSPLHVCVENVTPAESLVIESD